MVTHGDWGNQLKELIAAACDEEGLGDSELPMYPLYMFEPSHRWEHKRGVTLLGDAAHLKSPFAGEGVISAMLDALQLAQKIISAWGEDTALDEAVKEYEEVMFPRAKSNGEQTWKNLHMIMAVIETSLCSHFIESGGTEENRRSSRAFLESSGRWAPIPSSSCTTTPDLFATIASSVVSSERDSKLGISPHSLRARRPESTMKI